MPTKTSSGILLFRRRGALEVLLAHPGGPFWARKDEGAWFIVKGEVNPDEDLLAAARREFREELGVDVPPGELVSLGTVKNKSGKVIHAWALEGDLDVTRIVSNTCEIEWPPRSGKRVSIPEIDRAEYFSIEEATRKMSASERVLLERLVQLVAPTQKK